MWCVFQHNLFLLFFTLVLVEWSLYLRYWLDFTLFTSLSLFLSRMHPVSNTQECLISLQIIGLYRTTIEHWKSDERERERKVERRAKKEKRMEGNKRRAQIMTRNSSARKMCSLLFFRWMGRKASSHSRRERKEILTEIIRQRNYLTLSNILTITEKKESVVTLNISVNLCNLKLQFSQKWTKRVFCAPFRLSLSIPPFSIFLLTTILSFLWRERNDDQRVNWVASFFSNFNRAAHFLTKFMVWRGGHFS